MITESSLIKDGGLSPYIEDINKMEWSHSRLTSYFNCKYAFYLNYIEDPRRKKDPNFYAENGKLVHEVLSIIFKHIQLGTYKESTMDDALYFFVNNYDEYVKHKTKESTVKNTFEACSDYFAEVEFNWLDGYEIVGVERELHHEIEGYKYIVYIDLLLRNKETGKFVIVDHKSAAYPFKKDGTVLKNHIDSFESYKRQMYLYADSVIKEYEVPRDSISELWWNHFKVGGRLAKINFSDKEFCDTQSWFLDTIDSIKHESEFAPNYNYFMCTNLCDFRNTCEYAKAKFGRNKWKRK